MRVTIVMDLDNEAVNRFNSLVRCVAGIGATFMDLLEMDMEASARKIDRLARVEIKTEKN